MRPAPSCLFVTSLALLGCRREASRPDPARTEVSPSSSSSAGSAVTATASASAPLPVERLAPLKAHVEGKVRPTHVVAFFPEAVPDARDLAEADRRAQDSFSARTWHARLLPVGERLIVARAGVLYVLDGGTLSLDTKFIASDPLAEAYSVDWLAGSWPHSLWASASFSYFVVRSPNSEDRGVFHRREGKWSRLDVAQTPSSMAAWKNGALLGTVNGELRVFDGQQGLEPPLQAKAPEGGSCQAGRPLVAAKQVAALGSGEVFTLGDRCDTDEWAIERWVQGATKSEIISLPRPQKPVPAKARPPTQYMLAAASPSSVYAMVRNGEQSLVTRLDGGTMQPIELPDPMGLSSAYALADGTLFVLLQTIPSSSNGASLYRLSPSGQWARYALPDSSCCGSLSFGNVWASDAETAFVGAGAQGNGNQAAFLVSTRPGRLFGDPPARLSDYFAKPNKREPSPAPAAPSSRAADDPPVPPYGPGCSRPFVFLFEVSKTAPADFTFPSTRKTLSTFEMRAQVKLVEFVHERLRKLGAEVPSGEVGQALVEHIKATTKDEDPKLVCFAPSRGVRAIAMP